MEGATVSADWIVAAQRSEMGTRFDLLQLGLARAAFRARPSVGADIMTIAISGFFGWMLLIIFAIFSIILIFLWFTLPLVVSQKLDEIVGEARAANVILEELNRTLKSSQPGAGASRQQPAT